MERVMITLMLKSRPLLWGIAVAGLIVSTAGVSAGIAKGGLPGPGWFAAGVAGALTALVATAAALRPVFVRVVETSVDRSIKQSDTARELRARLGGANGKFPRVSEIRDRALRYGVQQAIPLDGGPVEGLSVDLPRYLPRTIDGPLRSALTSRSTTGGMVILKGNSAWGKSRSMLEAVSQVLDDWSIVAPSKASDVRDLVESGMPLRRTVIWLDELIDFLTGSDPLMRETVQRAVDKGAILVGTIWKDDFAALTIPPKKRTMEGSDTSGHSSGSSGVDVLADARAILTATYRDLVEMPRGLDADEAAVASALAKQDPRWAQAVADSGELSPIQVLAAAPQLLERYRSPDDEVGGIVLRTAVALLAMEHPPPVPSGLLRRVAQVSIPPTLELEPDRWFEEALDWARRPVRGTIAPLKAYRRGAGESEGFVSPDLLVSAAREDGQLLDYVDLDLLIAHATAEACASVGSFFLFRYGEAEARPLLRRAVEQGVARAFLPYGLLSIQAGRAGEAEEWFRKAAEAGSTVAFFNLGLLLSGQVGREGEAEEWYCKAADAGDTDAAVNLGNLLSDQEGREGEAEEWYRKAADAGEPDAAHNLGNLLSDQGREGEAEEWYRKAIEAGSIDALNNLGDLLMKQGRYAEARLVLAQGTELGHRYAMFSMGELELLENHRGDAQVWLRKAAHLGVIEARDLLYEEFGEDLSGTGP